MTDTCTHLDQIEITELPAEVAGCEDCLATGGRWLHLRICLECGKVGCCDDSPNRHATALVARRLGSLLGKANARERPGP
jgi:ubiquitin-hydrolase Zn-finger-containing protein